MFNFKRKNSCNCTCKNDGDNLSADIKILGGGCDKCHTLEDNAKKAVEQLGLDYEVGHVSDFNKIAEYGVMTTPALMIKDHVVSSGEVLSVQQIMDKLKEIK